MSAIQQVPTNIITGFLGAGKTTAILRLMENKPEHERWAILVNEFGEIGVDGELFEGQGDNQVQIKEVPGGCMCCTAGLPMQIALNQLLTQAKPDRLIIEPSGLGHPKEVLQTLSGEHYKTALKIEKIVTLVDARQLVDTRYTDHDTFNQQIEIADIVVGSKVDLYQDCEMDALSDYVSGFSIPYQQVIFTHNGHLNLDMLAGSTQSTTKPSHHHHHGSNKPLASELPLPESGILRVENQGDGYHSVGWRFSPLKIFSHANLRQTIAKLQVERVKAVFITDEGVFGYNQTQDGLMEMPLNDASESRIEIIAEQQLEDLDAQLLECVVSHTGIQL